MAHPLWPLFDLSVTTPRLTMRLPDDNELAELATIADESIFANSPSMPFFIDWPSLPSPYRELSIYQFMTMTRANWKPQQWDLPMVAFLDEKPIGIQALEAKNFGKLGVVETGSYLGAAWQGQGYGTEMRAAVLELAFAELNAVEAHSTARSDNPRSKGVSFKLGYEENGVCRAHFGEEVGEDIRLRLTREAWEEHRLPGISVDGIDACRHFFGGAGETWQTASVP